MRVLTILLLAPTLLNVTTDDFEKGYLKEDRNKEGYHFWSDTKEFIWFRFENDIKEFGRGTFDVTNDSITLSFGPARKQFDVEEERIFVDQGNESIEVIFSDQYGKPIDGLQLTLKKTGVSAITGQDGVAILHTGNLKINKVELDFQFGNYRTYQRTVSLKRQTYKFNVVADQGRKYKENQTEQVGFEIKARGIEVTNRHNTTWFKKVSRKKFLDVYHGIRK